MAPAAGMGGGVGLSAGQGALLPSGGFPGAGITAGGDFLGGGALTTPGNLTNMGGSLWDSLLDKGKDYIEDKIKNPNTYKDIFDAVTGGGGKGEGQTGSVGQNLALMLQNQPISLPNRTSPEQIAEMMMQRGQQGGQQSGQGIPLGVNITV